MLDSSKIVDIVLEFLECQLTSKMDIFLTFLKNFVSDVDGLSCALGFRFANCQVIFSTQLFTSYIRITKKFKILHF